MAHPFSTLGWREKDKTDANTCEACGKYNAQAGDEHCVFCFFQFVSILLQSRSSNNARVENTTASAISQLPNSSTELFIENDTSIKSNEQKEF
uniref:Uncharacterized protein n=1 Tax=Ciona intestinalis TaxID=7719 RepID=H2XTV6_CIOIN